jgi:hypothetical protein
MSDPFDSASRSDERRAAADQEIAPAAEIRAYLARRGGPSDLAQAVTPVAAEPAPTPEVVSDVKAEPEPTVVAPAPVVLEPAPVVMEDAATELPVVEATHTTTPVHIEPAEPSAAQSVGIQASEPEPVTPEPEPIALELPPTPAEPEPISAHLEPAAVVNAVSEPPVPDAAPAPTIAPPQATASHASANSNNIDVVPERVTNTATAREAPPPPPPGKPTQARSNIPLYLLALTTALALGAVAYQTYLLRQSLNIIDRVSQRMDRVQQQNEFVRACRDLSDAYFLVKQRVAPLMAVPDRSNIAGAARISEINRLEAQDAIARLAALGAFLGNAQDAAARERYAELSRVLTRIAEDAKGKPLTEFDKAFEPADKLFAQVNSDCARVSQFPKT